MSIEALKWLQLAQTVLLFILPALIVACVAGKRKPLHWWHLDRGLAWPYVAYGILAILIAAPGINLLADLNSRMVLPECLAGWEAHMKAMEEQAAAVTEAFLRTDSLWGLMINIGLMAILPAFAEELTFRGTLMRSNRPWCIWLVAILFSAIHLQFYGFVPRMLLGAWFGYMLVWSGSLWLPILMHLTNNTLAVLTYDYAFRHELDLDSMETLGTGDTLWLGIASILLTILSIYAIQRYSRTRRD